MSGPPALFASMPRTLFSTLVPAAPLKLPRRRLRLPLTESSTPIHPRPTRRSVIKRLRILHTDFNPGNSHPCFQCPSRRTLEPLPSRSVPSHQHFRTVCQHSPYSGAHSRDCSGYNCSSYDCSSYDHTSCHNCEHTCSHACEQLCDSAAT